ncbi:MAG: hypothetical protein IJ518_02425 [Clostridia bacterium]|nr:hypothetical protein [Clostridia bacterium]
MKLVRIVRNKENKHFGIEVSPEIHGKLQYIAKYEGRSMNGQILYLVNRCIREFEEINGGIVLEQSEKTD